MTTLFSALQTSALQTSTRRTPSQRKTTALLIAALIAGGAFYGASPDAYAQNKNTAGTRQSADPRDVNLNFQNVDIDSVVRAISQFTGRTFIVDPRVKGTISVVSERPVTKDEALVALMSALRMQGFTVVEAGGIARVVPEQDAKLIGGPVDVGPVRRVSGRGDQLVTQVFRLNFESANNMIGVLRPMIAPNNTITAYPNNNTLVITDYAENLQKINRVIAAIDTPAGSDLEVVTLQHAIAADMAGVLNRLLDVGAGASDPTQRVTVIAESRTNQLLLRSASPARTAMAKTLINRLDVPGKTTGNINIVPVRNTEATRLAQTLRAIVTSDSGFMPQASQGFTPSSVAPSGGQAPGTTGASVTAAAPVTSAPSGGAGASSGGLGSGMIQADPVTNSLIINAPEPMYRQLRALIDKLDVRRAQLLIESLIVEVTNDQAAEFGIQWQTGLNRTNDGSQNNAIGGTNFGGAGQNIVGIAGNIATVGQGFSVGIIRGRTTLPGGQEILNLGFLARALDQKGNTNILSAPSVVTLDNEEGRIVVGQNLPFVTGQFTNTGAGSGSSTVNPFQTIERRDVGLTLRVKPKIFDGGLVQVQTFLEVSSLASSSASGPITNKRSAENMAIIDDGGIMVLGGLYQDQVDANESKVPIAGDLPLIGNLFRYDTRRRQKTNLMVFLRPYVMRDEASTNAIVNERYEAIRNAQEQARVPDRFLLPRMPGTTLPKLNEPLYGTKTDGEDVSINVAPTTQAPAPASAAPPAKSQEPSAQPDAAAPKRKRKK